MGINSVDEFKAYIETLKTKYENWIDKESPAGLYFRGHADKDYKLEPSIVRTLKYDLDPIFVNEKLFEDIATERNEFYCGNYDPMTLHALLQHHYIPTRVLDITSCPLIALYFACQSKKDENGNETDGEVIVFNRKDAATENDPIVNIIADSSHLVSGWDWSLKSFYEKASEKGYFKEPEEVKDGNVGPVDWIRDWCSGERIIYADAEAITGRQKMQHAGYIVFPNVVREDSDGELAFVDELVAIEGHEDIVDRIQIPARLKPALLEYLGGKGISKDTIDFDSEYDYKEVDKVAETAKKLINLADEPIRCTMEKIDESQKH